MPRCLTLAFCLGVIAFSAGGLAVVDRGAGDIARQAAGDPGIADVRTTMTKQDGRFTRDVPAASPAASTAAHAAIPVEVADAVTRSASATAEVAADRRQEKHVDIADVQPGNDDRALHRERFALGGSVDCPDGAIHMDEPCGDDVYGGCNMDEPNFFEANCGDTICGTAWADGAMRDTDWFEVVIHQPTTFTFSGTAEFPFRIGLVNTNGSGDCDDATGLNPQANGDAGTIQSITATVGPGTYWFFIADQNFHGNPCGSGSNDYYVTIACESADAGCGVPGMGACCQANDSPYCEDEACCEQICSDDPFCCDDEWDQACADAASDEETGCDVCITCGFADAGDCCEGQVGSPYCSDESCCQQVCADDPYCCDFTWDSVCAATANDVCEVCFECGHHNSGTCCEANDTTHCDFELCCDQICAEDPFCCDVQWDEACAEAANNTETGCINCIPLPCPKGGIPEPEKCGEDTNGGCNMMDPAFTPIQCGDIYCGTAWADDGWRDTDWYEIVVGPDEAYEVTWTAYAEFPIVIGLIANQGSGTCSGAGALDPFATADAGQEVSITAELTPGTWWLFVAPQNFDGNPCGSGVNEYWVSLSCEEIDHCIGDLIGNGSTGVLDLLYLIENWGQCPHEGLPGSCEGLCGNADETCWCDEACCAFGDCCLDKHEVCGGCEPATAHCHADLNGDETVGVADLLILLADWGCQIDLPDPIGCPDGAIEMDEPCGAELYNGCNMDEPNFFNADCGDTICGTAWAHDGFRDTDWIEVVVEEQTTFTFTGTAEFPFVIGLVDTNGSGDCDGADMLDPFQTGDAFSTISFTTTVEPGTYWFFIADQGFDGNQCGTGFNDFYVTITCE